MPLYYSFQGIDYSKVSLNSFAAELRKYAVSSKWADAAFIHLTAFTLRVHFRFLEIGQLQPANPIERVLEITVSDNPRAAVTMAYFTHQHFAALNSSQNSDVFPPSRHNVENMQSYEWTAFFNNNAALLRQNFENWDYFTSRTMSLKSLGVLQGYWNLTEPVETTAKRVGYPVEYE
jgi:hypothetical protein